MADAEKAPEGEIIKPEEKVVEKPEEKTALEKVKEVVLPDAKPAEAPPTAEEAKTLEERCLCMTITVMVLSIFGINLFSFLFSLFMLISVNGDETTRYHWKRVVKIFYIISLVVLIIGVVVFIIILIVACIRGRGFTCAFSIYIIVISVLEFIFSIIGYNKLVTLTEKKIVHPDLPDYSKLSS